MKFGAPYFVIAAISFLFGGHSYAWDDHRTLTKLSLKGWDQWEAVSFEPLEKVLPVLRLGAKTFKSRQEFFEALQIRGDKVPWDEPGQSVVGEPYGLSLVAWSSDHPDLGMDQELDLSPYQEFIGGRTGLSSQAIRHMVFPAFDWHMPLITFHLPIPYEVFGYAPDRAQIFFDLAIQARKSGHWYWAYRFFGMGLHYVQDIAQPYHAHQFGSLVLLPYKKILQGKKEFLDEATRVVSNYHLVFEKFTSFYVQKATEGANLAPEHVFLIIQNAFKVPKGDEELSKFLNTNGDVSVKEMVNRLSLASAKLCPNVVREEFGLFDKQLMDPALRIGDGFFQANGAPKIDLTQLEKVEVPTGTLKKRKAFLEVMGEGLSNMVVSTRWIFDKFRLQ